MEANGEVLLRFAVANGFRNIQNIIQKIKRGKMTYDFVEIMACPSGKFRHNLTSYFICDTCVWLYLLWHAAK